MSGFGSGNYNIQNRGAAEGSAGGPSSTPGRNDKRVAVLGGAAVLIVAILLAFLR